MDIIVGAFGVILAAIAAVIVVAALLVIIIGIVAAWDVIRNKPWRNV